MSTQPYACLTSDLSPFCVNDQLYTSKLVARNQPTFSLPNCDDLLTSINHAYQVTESPVSLIVVGLSTFSAGHSEPDEFTCQLASLAVAAKLEQCLRHHYSTNSPDSDIEVRSVHQAARSGPDTPLNATRVYRLTALQFACLSDSIGERLGSLCQSILITLDQPLYIGDQILGTRSHIGIAHGQKHQRPESLLLSARSALFTCRQQ